MTRIIMWDVVVKVRKVCHVVPQHEGRTQSIHVCAHKQQYIAVEAKQFLIIILVQDQAA